MPPSARRRKAAAHRERDAARKRAARASVRGVEMGSSPDFNPKKRAAKNTADGRLLGVAFQDSRTGRVTEVVKNRRAFPSDEPALAQSGRGLTTLDAIGPTEGFDHRDLLTASPACRRASTSWSSSSPRSRARSPASGSST